ncbi:MAG: peroxiredoxin [Woeseiaceae bacterium]|nr:peroxiredoxin [Woeseiaceae bacterium]
MLKIGSKAPEFVLQSDSGTETSLTDLLKDGPLVLYFYPADFTPGCTKEACDIRDIHSDLVAVGLRVAGISPQDVDSPARFRDKHQQPFGLLSDIDKTAIKMYDVDGPFGVGVRRATFLVSQDRLIKDVVNADVRIGRHKEFIQKAIILRETAGMRSDASDS